MPERYILRFKVLKLSCTSLKNGQQYIITYRRGDTHRSTPCYVAEGGEVDFGTMPEGAAIVNLKPGGVRFLPKWVMFRVEEYTRGLPRKTVGETQLDCAEVLGLRNIDAAVTRRVSLAMSGAPAEMLVAVLLYPENHAPLSFDSISPSSLSVRDGSGQQEASKESGNVRHMERSEAMVLLISMETMLERRRLQKVSSDDDMPPLQKRLMELEERRRCMTGVDGMAAKVVHKRVRDVVAAQFLSLSRKQRENYVGEVAAYLRQLAVKSGVPLTTKNYKEREITTDVESARGRTQQIDSRIEALTQQMQKLEKERDGIGRLQGRADVANELDAVMSKIETLQSQIRLLVKSRDALGDLMRGSGDEVTPIGQEVQKIRQRVLALTAEQQLLEEQIQRMMTVATKHVLKWARSKNPPTEDLSTGLERLFAVTDEQKQYRQQQQLKNLGDGLSSLEQQKIMEALSNAAQASAPTVNSGSSSEANESPRGKPPNLSGETGFLSVNDFENTERESTSDPNVPSASLHEKLSGKHVDPLFVDLGSHMFTDKTEEKYGGGQEESSSWNFSFAPKEKGGGDDRVESMPVTAVIITRDDERGMFAVDRDSMYDFQRPVEVPRTSAVTVEIDDSSLYQAVTGIGEAKELFNTDSTLFGNNDKHGNVQVLPTYNFDSDPAPKDDTATSVRDTKLHAPLYNFGS